MNDNYREAISAANKLASIFYRAIFVIILVAFRGLVISYWWLWFVVPTFTGAQPISALQALLISALSRMMIGRRSQSSSAATSGKATIEWSYLLDQAATLLFVFGIGYLAHLVMS